MGSRRRAGLELEGREPFLSAAATLLRESGCVIREYRTNLTGTAYTSSADWGIETPRPTTPRRFAVLAHEVGHQCLHRGRAGYPRWREEMDAEDFALRQMRRFELPGYDEVLRDVITSTAYSFSKALRRSRRPLVLMHRMNAVATDWARAGDVIDQAARRAHILIPS